MSDYRNFTRTSTQGGVVDQGLRAYMIRVFNYMALGLGITGLAGMLTLTSGIAPILFGSPLKWVVFFAPFAMVMFMSFRLQSMSASAAQITFWIFAALMGVSLTPIAFIYTGASITKVFFITAATFATMSLYGYTTKRDLTSMGSFLFMGLWGIILAMVVNIFLGSPAVSFAISVLGVVIFTGLTAWDVQKIKETYYYTGGSSTAGHYAIMGALNLYLDFINMFTSLLNLLGDRR